MARMRQHPRTGTTQQRIAGLEYKATESVMLRGGYVFDMTPIPSATLDTSLIDMDRHFVTAGGATFGDITIDFADVQAPYGKAGATSWVDLASTNSKHWSLHCIWVTSLTLLMVAVVTLPQLIKFKQTKLKTGSFVRKSRFFYCPFMGEELTLTIDGPAPLE